MPTLATTLTSRAQRIRRSLLVAIHHAGSGHPGGALSAVEILVALWERRFQTRAPNHDSDGFVFSKGHACPALYALGAEYGLLEHAELLRLRKLGSPLQGHTHVVDLPWTGASTGSLGQGFSVAIGKALALRHKGVERMTWCVLGDGELQEGEVWEGAMCAAHFKLSALCAIVDYNKLQSDDWNENVMGLEPLADKWRAFGWAVTEVDGHDIAQLDAAYAAAEAEAQRPTVIIAHTIKGRGVTYMERSPLWHGSVKLERDELERALEDLGVAPHELAQWVDGTVWSN